MKYFAVSIILVVSASMLTLSACGHTSVQKADLSKMSTEELIQLLENQKDGSNGDLFLDTVKELETRGQSASEAAPALAKAIAYDRRDSTTASRALIAMGPAAELAIPDLVENLNSKRADVRRYSVFVLGIIGRHSQCAVPKLAPLLWESDSGVRSATAAALKAITGENLVEPTQELDPTLPGSVFLDEPDGNVSGKARNWWLQTGRYMDWPEDNCKRTP